MSIDQLHNRIRKFKNPSMIHFEITPDILPPHLPEQEGSFSKAYDRFCRELLYALKDLVPAVRFSSSVFFMTGEEGRSILSGILCYAKELGYYILMDAPEILSPTAAQYASQVLGSNEYPCDSVIISPYIGSDAIKPFLPVCKAAKQALFAVVRSPNKSASELQDLQFGTRQAHIAAADIVSRHGESMIAKCGYSQIGALVSAGSPEILRNLRMKYPRVFLLVDGLDYPSGNFKNCSIAFDKFGHGAIVCAGTSVTAAWQENDGAGEDFVIHAVDAAEKVKRNLYRYVNVL